MGKSGSGSAGTVRHGAARDQLAANAVHSCSSITSLPPTLSRLGHDWEAFMGSTEDPADGAAVGTTCYVAALVYAAFAVFCGCQIGVHRRYSRIRL